MFLRSALQVLSVAAMLVVAPAVHAASVSIDIYKNTSTGMQFVSSHTDKEDAAIAADQLRRARVTILCIYSDSPQNFAICPSQVP
jgi:precorrin-6B methylase 1